MSVEIRSKHAALPSAQTGQNITGISCRNTPIKVPPKGLACLAAGSQAPDSAEMRDAYRWVYRCPKIPAFAANPSSLARRYQYR